ncbi:unnamed protein product [Rotaria magnacalcarata]|uniref:Uncharacterized protein n=1 Tax=Rotaria magnacalcarata TaxID=392030 RepID=A0A814MKB5_9BILA|nr:unnamed protein product [Rotaria magnacalcarata]CAF1496478.1 unnamed protein product [Rotaria magnacalcarata]CAF2044054.1 unnamed protein product [Rotaria magnacalcarata]CAF3774685.1 unnamed protein product [Rotaria magnacalcarata]CAF3796918.1 unnamed protein product [Rotaria magnacalcarata]
MNPNHLHYNPNGNAPLYDRTVPNTQNFNEQRIDSTTNQNVVWKPHGITTPRGVVTNSEPMQTQNFNERRIDSTTNQNVVWEPYGITTPRGVVTHREPMQTQNLNERRIDSTTNHNVVWKPHGITTPRGVVTNSEPMQTQNLNERRIDSTTNQNVVWEPYGVKNPRRAVTNDELMQSQNSKIDEDWLHAYATFSPYRTSNQDYGYRASHIHFIPNVSQNQPNSYNQVPNDPRQNSMNVNTSDRSFPQSSMLNLLAKNGLPPLAYRPLRRSQDTK